MPVNDATDHVAELRRVIPIANSFNRPVHEQSLAEIERLRAACRALLLHPAVPTGTDEWHLLARLLDGEAEMKTMRKDRGYD